MKKIQIYERGFDGEIIASTKPEAHKYLGEVKEGETFKVLFRDDMLLLTSFEANLDDVNFLDEYVEKDFRDEVSNAEPEDKGIKCDYQVVELKVECQADDVWTVEIVKISWEEVMNN